MPHDRIETMLRAALAALEAEGRLKGAETVIAGVLPAAGGRGPRFRVAGEGERAFLRMNANNYLGLSLHRAVGAAEEEGVQRFGTGPGAVRFISGTWAPHLALERSLPRSIGARRRWSSVPPTRR